MTAPAQTVESNRSRAWPPGGRRSAQPAAAAVGPRHLPPVDDPHARPAGDLGPRPAADHDRRAGGRRCSTRFDPRPVDAVELRDGHPERRHGQRVHQQPDRDHPVDGDPDHDRRLRRLRLRVDPVPRPGILFTIVVGAARRADPDVADPDPADLQRGQPVRHVPGHLAGPHGFGLPLAIFLLYNFISQLPRDLFESAAIDGASHLQAFIRIVLPLSIPALGAFAIFQFLWVWNDLLVALVFLGPGPDVRVLPTALYNLIGSRGGSWHLLTAGAFLTMVVPLIVFLLLQRAFVRGILAGSVKSWPPMGPYVDRHRRGGRPAHRTGRWTHRSPARWPSARPRRGAERVAGATARAAGPRRQRRLRARVRRGQPGQSGARYPRFGDDPEAVGGWPRRLRGLQVRGCRDRQAFPRRATRRRSAPGCRWCRGRIPSLADGSWSRFDWMLAHGWSYRPLRTPLGTPADQPVRLGPARPVARPGGSTA